MRTGLSEVLELSTAAVESLVKQSPLPCVPACSRTNTLLQSASFTWTNRDYTTEAGKRTEAVECTNGFRLAISCCFDLL